MQGSGRTIMLYRLHVEFTCCIVETHILRAKLLDYTERLLPQLDRTRMGIVDGLLVAQVRAEAAEVPNGHILSLIHI